MRRRFNALAADALREQQTPVAYSGALLEAEMAERAERGEKRRLINARFPQIKRVKDFRFADNPKVPQATVAALAEGSRIDDRESGIFIGDSGTRKTMLATALTVCGCHQGRRVRFTILAALANEPPGGPGNRKLERVIGRYARTELRVCDELGYLALPDGAAELVFQASLRRTRQLVLTTNLPSASAPRWSLAPPAETAIELAGFDPKAAGQMAATRTIARSVLQEARASSWPRLNACRHRRHWRPDQARARRVAPPSIKATPSTLGASRTGVEQSRTFDVS